MIMYTFFVSICINNISRFWSAIPLKKITIIQYFDKINVKLASDKAFKPQTPLTLKIIYYEKIAVVNNIISFFVHIQSIKCL